MRPPHFCMHVCLAHIYTLSDPSWDDLLRQPSQSYTGVEMRPAMRMDGCEAAAAPYTEQGCWRAVPHVFMSTRGWRAGNIP